MCASNYMVDGSLFDFKSQMLSLICTIEDASVHRTLHPEEAVEIDSITLPTFGIYSTQSSRCPHRGEEFYAVDLDLHMTPTHSALFMFLFMTRTFFDETGQLRSATNSQEVPGWVKRFSSDSVNRI